LNQHARTKRILSVAAIIYLTDLSNKPRAQLCHCNSLAARRTQPVSRDLHGEVVGGNERAEVLLSKRAIVGASLSYSVSEEASPALEQDPNNVRLIYSMRLEPKIIFSRLAG
jgi:hypothetical protein